VDSVLADIALHERVGADGHPLDEGVALPDLVAEEVGGPLVVPGGGQESAEHPHDRPLEHTLTIARSTRFLGDPKIPLCAA